MAPELVPLCSDPGPDGRVCPTGGSTSRGDALLVQFAGILGAAVATIFSIRKLRGSHDPYSLSVALALLKLPLGALTALLGLVLIHADLVPGLTVVGSATQILAWAIVFGYCQEIFTIFLDRHAIAVMQVSHVSKHQGTHTNPHH
jgi:CBS domain containing-hemolysin-like protein